MAAPPHRVAPGTPLNHTLVLGAYRFAFLIEPLEVPALMSPEMAALHKAFALAGIPMTNMPGMAPADVADLGPIFATSGLHPTQDFAVALALLVTRGRGFRDRRGVSSPSSRRRASHSRSGARR